MDRVFHSYRPASRAQLERTLRTWFARMTLEQRDQYLASCSVQERRAVERLGLEQRTGDEVV